MPLSGLNASVVKPGLSSVFFQKFNYDQIPSIAHAETSQLFIQEQTTMKAEVTEEFEGTGAWEETQEEEDRPLTSPRVGNQKTHTVVNFTKTIPISEDYFDDDQYSTVEKMVADAGRTGRIKRDKKALQLYPDGHSATTTSDGVALWSNSHTNLNGDTIDNLETGALNANNFETLWRSLVEQKANDGEIGSFNPVALLVPPILFPGAQETLKSELRPYGMDLEVNWVSLIYPGLQIFQSVFLGASQSAYANAATAHYLVSDSHSITRWIRKPISTQMVPPDTDSKDRWMFKAKYREIVSVISPFGAVASIGTT